MRDNRCALPEFLFEQLSLTLNAFKGRRGCPLQQGVFFSTRKAAKAVNRGGTAVFSSSAQCAEAFFITAYLITNIVWE